MAALTDFKYSQGKEKELRGRRRDKGMPKIATSIGQLGQQKDETGPSAGCHVGSLSTGHTHTRSVTGERVTWPVPGDEKPRKDLQESGFRENSGP